uniref:EF-hand domain-containing protein n=1 Tax=Macrostomum lignano TaxID=282301 RepID=A0A1I8FX72_9PLAT
MHSARQTGSSQLKSLLGIDPSSSVEMTESDLRQCMEAFRRFENKQGRFPVAKLIEGFEAAQTFVSETVIEESMNSLAAQGVESMEFYDFATLVCSKKLRKRRSTHACLKAIFRHLDQDSDGFISAEELQMSVEALMGDGEAGEPAERLAERMIGQLDTSGSGKVSYDQFVCMLNHSISS